MPVEFECLRCRAQLHVSDTAAGQQVRCPRCEAVLTPPVPGPIYADVVPEQAAYGWPSAGARPAKRLAHHGIQPQPIELQPLDATEALGRAWRIYIDNLGPCLLALFTVHVVALVGAVAISGPMMGLILAVEQGNRDAAFWPKVVIMVVFCLVTLLFATWLLSGLTLFHLNLARSGEARVSDVFSGGRRLFSFTFVHFATQIVTVLGLLLFIVPGVMAILVFFPAAYLVIDRDMSAGKALVSSVHLTRGNRVNLLLLILISMGVSLIAGFIPCVGILVYPLNMLYMIIGYLMMTGQQTAGVLKQPTAGGS